MRSYRNESLGARSSKFSTEEGDFTEIIHEYDNRHVLNEPVKRDSGHTYCTI